MNYKIAKTMLSLCIVYLIAFYIIKFFFPEMLLQSITNPTLLRLGEVVNSWIGWSHIINFVGTFATLYLFASASSGYFVKTKMQWVYIVAGMITTAVFYYLLPELYTHSCTSIMFIIAYLCKGKLIYATISFTIHGFLSQFLLSIRGFETIITIENAINHLSTLVLCSEVYLWLFLLTLIFYFKENKKYGNGVSPLSQQEH